ncbi:MAG: LysM peptidoglycan-binding domain-containing protein [bacterium]|nr:LysM peptidoglycan-binding domain-containing protein [bacterium]
MNRSEFFISAGAIFYLFVSLNYPILDILVDPVKAAARGATSNSSLESHYNLKSPDLLLSYTIKTHKWNVQSLKSPTKGATSKSIQKAKLLIKVLPRSSMKISTPTSSKPLTEVLPLTDPKIPLTIHVVKPGDTLWKIAAKYGVSSATICELNDLKRSDILAIGMKLQVSGVRKKLEVSS